MIAPLGRVFKPAPTTRFATATYLASLQVPGREILPTTLPAAWGPGVGTAPGPTSIARLSRNAQGVPMIVMSDHF